MWIFSSTVRHNTIQSNRSFPQKLDTNNISSGSRKVLQTKMHFDKCFSRSALHPNVDEKNVDEKMLENKLNVALFPIQSKHWLNDLWEDNSLKTRAENISKRMTTHKLVRK